MRHIDQIYILIDVQDHCSHDLVPTRSIPSRVLYLAFAFGRSFLGH